MATTPEQTLAHLRRMDERRRRDGRERAARLRARLGDAAALLRREHGAERVVVFGSILEEDRPPRDVDVAVGGMSKERYFQALADLMHVFGGPVDLVRLEEASESLRDRIEAEGEPL